MKQMTRVVLLVIVALLFPIIPFVVIGELPGERWLSATDANAWLFALTGSSILMIDVVLPVPSSIIVALLGSRLGFFGGWLSAWVGLTIGNMVGYAIGRLWPHKIAPDFAESPTLMVLFVSRPVPILAEAATIAAGASRINPIHMIAVCAASNLFYTAILAASGAALLAENVNFLTLFAPLLVPAVAWMAWRKYQARKVPSQADIV
jgi:uncharacterized membrane protein YdjX (TVP38/TMEM64 family)